MSARRRSTFYWAMRLLPRARREALFALYDIARAIDDVADGPGSAMERRAGLERWRRQVAAIYEGTPDDPVALAFRPHAHAFGLPRAELDALIDGQAMDLEPQKFDEALFVLYCRRVAGTIGMLSLPIFGASGEGAHRYALALGEALQRVNVLRDIDEDAARGRDYLPEPRDAFAARAAEKLAAARAMLPGLDRHALRPAIVMGELYATLLARVRAGRRLSRLDKLVAVLRGLWASR
ncbi:MAG: squalene/phytoene synthase family protein [Rhodospirillales bacterium]|nr:squalene/phytoene synthase family protein [Rhodospirillales bacterium]